MSSLDELIQEKLFTAVHGVAVLLGAFFVALCRLNFPPKRTLGEGAWWLSVLWYYFWYLLISFYVICFFELH